MAATAPLLEVEDLTYSYDGRPAVQGLSFVLHRGEVLGFLGPNGAGKTTTFSCLAGLLGRYGGCLRWAGEPFRPHAEPAHRARLGLVPQDVALYPELTARENLAFFGRLQGLRGPELAAAVDRALDLAGLAERADDRVKAFSGGMRRRLNLAAGDLHRPEVLLLDEPTVGVDPQSRNHIFEALGRLREEGRTVLYSTHYMEEAQRLCDRVVILNEGRVLASGTCVEVAAACGEPGADLETVFLKLTGRRLRDD